MRKFPAHNLKPGAAGEALVTSPDGSTVEWGTAGATSLEGLADVDVTTVAPADGDTLVWDPTAGPTGTGAYVPGAVSAPPATLEPTRLVPLTTVVGGVPELVWDEDNNLVMTEVPR